MYARRRDARRFVAIAMLGLATLTACPSGQRSGVSVRALAADLVFGIPPLPEPAPPPNIQVTPDEPTGVVIHRTFSPGPRSTPPPTIAEPDCPEAEATDFPETEATTEVAGEPKYGSYRWVVSGEQQVPTVGTQQHPQFVRRSLLKVTTTGQAAAGFFYATEEKELVFGSQDDVRIIYNVIPNDGIYITQIRRASPSRTRTFNPRPPVKVLTTPVILNSTLDQVGVDPTTQEVLHHVGRVARRHRIDACGTVLDSWLVEGEQDFTSVSGASYSRKYDYSICTQLGGFTCFEHVLIPKTNATFTMDARLGQTTPG